MIATRYLAFYISARKSKVYGILLRGTRNAVRSRMPIDRNDYRLNSLGVKEISSVCSFSSHSHLDLLRSTPSVPEDYSARGEALSGVECFALEIRDRQQGDLGEVVGNTE
jgi:hypothetical protein